jgi:hypothetical protein
MMHNKTMVVDGMFSVVGSINLDARSMYPTIDSLAGIFVHAA